MMEKKPRRLSVPPDSELASIIRAAVTTGEPLLVDTGDASYRLEVSPAEAPPSSARLRQLAHQLAGSLADRDIPGWESSEAAEQWVENLRRADTYPLDSAQP